MGIVGLFVIGYANEYSGYCLDADAIIGEYRGGIH